MTTFAGARGPLPKLADVMSARARARRLAMLRRWLPPTARVLDVGCGDAGLIAVAPDLDITGVDVRPRPGYPGRFVMADATEESLFGPAVPEHLGPLVKSWIC